MTKVKFASAAANGNDDFEPVAVGQHLLAMSAARNDFAVALERDAFAGELQLLEQLQTVERLLKLAGYAIDGESDQDEIFRGRLAKQNSCSLRVIWQLWRCGAGSARPVILVDRPNVTYSRPISLKAQSVRQ